jgi:hypothetical protein
MGRFRMSRRSQGPFSARGSATRSAPARLTPRSRPSRRPQRTRNLGTSACRIGAQEAIRSNEPTPYPHASIEASIKEACSIGISLGSPCTLRLRRKRGSGWERRSLVVPPRSVYLLRGPSRTEWEHSIPPLATLRYSIMFRNLARRAASGR